EGRAFGSNLGFRTVLSVPLLREGVAIGTIALRRTEVRLFTDKQIALLRTFADQAVIAIENVRLFTELGERNRDLTVALDQQPATSEILRVISGSPTDVQPVFDAIVQSGTRLCEAAFGAAFRFDGQLQTFTAHYNVTPAEVESMHRRYPRPATRDAATGGAIVDRQIIHIHDIREDPEYRSPAPQTIGWPTVLALPILPGGGPNRPFGLWARDVRPFT